MQMESRRSEGPAVSESSDDRALLATGHRAEGEFRCAECAYGVTVYSTLPVCPMCAGKSWEQTAWRPFSRARWLR